MGGQGGERGGGLKARRVCVCEWSAEGRRGADSERDGRGAGGSRHLDGLDGAAHRLVDHLRAATRVDTPPRAI